MQMRPETSDKQNRARDRESSWSLGEVDRGAIVKEIGRKRPRLLVEIILCSVNYRFHRGVEHAFNQNAQGKLFNDSVGIIKQMLAVSDV